MEHWEGNLDGTYAKIKAYPLDIIHAFYIDLPWFVWTDDEPEILFFRSSYIQNQQSYLMMNSIVKNITTKLSIISIMKTIHGNWTLPSESWRSRVMFLWFDQYWILIFSKKNLLQLISRGDDEGDSGYEHHGEREECQELGELAEIGSPLNTKTNNKE